MRVPREVLKVNGGRMWLLRKRFSSSKKIMDFEKGISMEGFFEVFFTGIVI